jgi:hypothetical protein
MSKLFHIKIESLEKDKYTITFEDDVAVTHVESTSPQKDILKLLSDAGIKGKRGKKPTVRAIDPKAVDVPF